MSITKSAAWCGALILSTAVFCVGCAAKSPESSVLVTPATAAAATEKDESHMSEQQRVNAQAIQSANAKIKPQKSPGQN